MWFYFTSLLYFVPSLVDLAGLVDLVVPRYLAVLVVLAVPSLLVVVVQVVVPIHLVVVLAVVPGLVRAVDPILLVVLVDPVDPVVSLNEPIINELLQIASPNDTHFSSPLTDEELIIPLTIDKDSNSIFVNINKIICNIYLFNCIDLIFSNKQSNICMWC